MSVQQCHFLSCRVRGERLGPPVTPPWLLQRRPGVTGRLWTPSMNRRTTRSKTCFTVRADPVTWTCEPTHWGLCRKYKLPPVRWWSPCQCRLWPVPSPHSFILQLLLSNYGHWFSLSSGHTSAWQLASVRGLARLLTADLCSHTVCLRWPI